MGRFKLKREQVLKKLDEQIESERNETKSKRWAVVEKVQRRPVKADIPGSSPGSPAKQRTRQKI